MGSVAATSSYAVDFRTPRVTAPSDSRPGRVMRVARTLALAHQLEARVRSGEFTDLADAARKLGLTRARVTQIVNLTLLAPEIQEEILAWPTVTAGRDPVTERTIRRIIAEPQWRRQTAVWTRLGPRYVAGALPGRDSS